MVAKRLREIIIQFVKRFLPDTARVGFESCQIIRELSLLSTGRVSLLMLKSHKRVSRNENCIML